jgi:cold shock protein
LARFNQHGATSSFDEGSPVRAQVKWFNVTKGFGFVAPVDGTPDAFLHVSVLSRAGLQELSDGTEILCTIGAGPKGPQVSRLIEVLGEGAPQAARPRTERSDRGGFGGGGYGDRGDRGGFGGGGYGDRGDRGGYGGGGYGDRGDRGGYGGGGYGAQSSGPEFEISGTVKWFKPDKGFGFVTADDESKDVFVHKSVLRRCNIMSLDSGQRVQMRVQEADKGREATWISLL